MGGVKKWGTGCLAGLISQHIVSSMHTHFLYFFCIFWQDKKLGKKQIGSDIKIRYHRFLKKVNSLDMLEISKILDSQNSCV